MGNIIYRHYQEGDEEQLANLFNLAFQMNGAGIVRTPKSWNWRYVQSPGFEPEMCLIAEVKDKKLIVGATIVSLVENISLNDKTYLTADINDVSCHPDYIGRGIASNLMRIAIDYIKKRECDISILTANYDSFPRKKIYVKLGYVDIDREYLFLNFPNLFKLIKDFLAFGFLFLVFFVLSYIPRFLNRIRLKFNKFFKDFSYEISYNKKHFEYMEAANRIIPKYYIGFPLYNKKKFKWARIKVPARQQKPTYIFIKNRGKNKEKIIGGAVITHQNIYAFKYGIKFRFGVIHEIFLDKTEFENKKNLHFGYIYLIDKIIKAATQRFIPVLSYQSTSLDYDLHWALRSFSFFKFKYDSVMIKAMKENIRIPKFKKPLYIPSYISTGVP